ncbi:hypothetical protein LZ32DRAFT_208577 [Colletotrichum eremochloae]|nr:hypothetical protein LZ32DRAFT_208577 [Colletotrichum eremochloae]
MSDAPRKTLHWPLPELGILFPLLWIGGLTGKAAAPPISPRRRDPVVSPSICVVVQKPSQTDTFVSQPARQPALVTKRRGPARKWAARKKKKKALGCRMRCDQAIPSGGGSTEPDWSVVQVVCRTADVRLNEKMWRPLKSNVGTPGTNGACPSNPSKGSRA